MPVFTDENDARYWRTCQMSLEYINKYREKDTFYHVTRKENVDSLLSRGFDPARIGTGGGCQGGTGLSCSWCVFDAEDWIDKLNWGSALSAILKVSIPDVKLASQWDCYCMGKQEATTWGLSQGYLRRKEGETCTPTKKLEALYRNSPFLADPGWALLGQYVLTLGYDGYFIGIDEVVITNFRRLSAEAFTLL